MTDGEGRILSVKAGSYAECIDKIKSTYESDYFIKGKRPAKIGGFLGFFGKDGVEVKFTLIPSAVSRSAESSPQRISEKQTEISAALQYGKSALPASGADDFENRKKQVLAATGMLQTVQIKEVLEEVRSLREDISLSKNTEDTANHASFSKITALLEDNEFSSAYIKQIVQRMRKEFTVDKLDDFDAVQDTVVDWIGESISVFVPNYTARPQVIVLVGPTGIGKTTTIAKMAGQLIGSDSTVMPPREIRMITTDNVRIGAKEQLERYGEIMGIPVENPKNEDELKSLLHLYNRGVEYILIDTPGYSPKDYENIARLRKFLNVKNVAVEFYLAVSASTKFSDMCDIIQQYEIFGYRSVIITKFDETDHVGTIISALWEKGKSVSWLATGQSVPRCLEASSVVRFLTQLRGFNINRDRIEEKFLVKKINI
ncbi:MAG: hypothetical protein NC041_05070 [Bacteroides sp.]|nr:hypothetical protein [Prevotella sp.]MCM1407329.1 flagellar biosynthesis protein FlhF [Treponema brennaborense]MCM1469819.1 hypothetical protein [Bacteroides sp.]